MSADDVTAMLVRHYLPEGRPAAGILAPEIGAPDGRRRADAIWVPLTMAGGAGLVGHEIKCSRADVVTEITDHTKAESWSQYCSQWWLTVSDPAIVEGLEIPAAWGIMAPPSGRRTRSMTIVRPAPKLDPKEPAIAMRRVLSWYMNHVGSQVDRARYQREYDQREIERLRQEVADLRLSGGGHTSPHVKRINDIQRRVKAILQERQVWMIHDDNDEDVAQAIADLAEARKMQQSMLREAASLIRSAEHLTSPFAKVAADLHALLDEPIKASA